MQFITAKTQLLYCHAGVSKAIEMAEYNTCLRIAVTDSLGNELKVYPENYYPSADEMMEEFNKYCGKRVIIYRYYGHDEDPDKYSWITCIGNSIYYVTQYQIDY